MDGLNWTELRTQLRWELGYKIPFQNTDQSAARSLKVGFARIPATKNWRNPYCADYTLDKQGITRRGLYTLPTTSFR